MSEFPTRGVYFTHVTRLLRAMQVSPASKNLEFAGNRLVDGEPSEHRLAEGK